MQEVYIVSAVRTPICRFGGILADLSPVDLGALAMQAAFKAGIPERVNGYAVDMVYSSGIGHSSQLSDGAADLVLASKEAINSNQ